MNTIIRIWFFAMLCLVATARAQSDAQSATWDRAIAAKNLVNDVLHLPAYSHVSFYEKRARLLGDSVGIAIVKLLGPKELRDVDNGKRVINLLRDAYSDRSLIRAEDDKNPGVTLLVLSYLTEHSTDPAIREQARELSATIEALK